MAQKRPRTDDGPDDILNTPDRSSIPRISRTRACAECKRHKIKCEMKPGQTTCAKCLRSGIECVPHDLSKRFVDQDAAWKNQATADMQQLQAAVSHLLQHNHLPDLSEYQLDSKLKTPTVQEPIRSSTRNNSPPAPMAISRDNSRESSYDDSNLIPAPMRSLYNLTKPQNRKGRNQHNASHHSVNDDFIARGFVSIEDAEFLFEQYLQKINQLLWAGVTVVHTCLESCRRSSALLTAAILTVAALLNRDKSEVLNKCYNTYVSLVCSSSLSRHRNLDDIRALVIGAFYISNLSWKLTGQAVQIATEMNLHKSFQKLIQGDVSHYERARLWYVLYVCDHQFSIAYGRPPVTPDNIAIRNLEKFLQSLAAVPGDVRLMAQVALFRILTDAYTVYGEEAERVLTEADLEKLTTYNFEVEQWRFLWQKRSADSPYVKSYPSKGVVLYYHFARFQLNSLALRGIPPPNIYNIMTPASNVSNPSHDSLPFRFSLNRREAANIAVSSAINTLSLILDEPDIRDFLIGTPIFTHTMVAFCAVFLLKLASTWGHNQISSPSGNAAAGASSFPADGAYLAFNARSTLVLVRRSVDVLDSMASQVSEKHLVSHIAVGCKRMLEKYDAPDNTQQAAGPQPPKASAVDQLLAAANDVSFTGHTAKLQDVQNSASTFDLRDMAGTYGFGFDEGILEHSAVEDFDFWNF